MFGQHLPLMALALAFGIAILVLHRQVSSLRASIDSMTAAPIVPTPEPLTQQPAVPATDSVAETLVEIPQQQRQKSILKKTKTVAESLE